MDRKSTYVFLKRHETGIFYGKDLPEDGIEWKYLEHVGVPSSFSSYLPDDKFRISEEAKDFIEQYERDYRPIIAAEKSNELSEIANRKADRANFISFIALIIAVLSYLK